MAFIILAGLALAGIIYFFTKRAVDQKATAVGNVDTPGYTENKVDDQFVLVTFRPQKQQPVTVEYYFNKNQYKSPQDFLQLNKTVTVKYDPANPSNYTIHEVSKGDYTRVITCLVIALLFGALAATTSDGDGLSKSKSFLLTSVITYVAVYIVIRLNALFSFLNIFTKREE
jgi:hypothetical protein